MRFISFASNIGPAAAVPAGPAPTPLNLTGAWKQSYIVLLVRETWVGT